MNETLKAIVGVLEAGRPELQVAAAQILGELGHKDTAIVRALAGAMRRSPLLARYAADALARIGSSEAWATVCRGLLESEALAEHVAHLLAEVVAAEGTKTDASKVVYEGLVGLYGEATPETRLRILSVLSRKLRKEAIPVFLAALLTHELSDHALRLLLQVRADLDTGMRKVLREQLARQLGQAQAELCRCNALQLLAQLDGTEARGLLLEHTDAEHSMTVRAAALRALHGMKLPAAQLRQFLDWLLDPAQAELHIPLQELFAELPELPEGFLPACRQLLNSRNPEQRLFALQMLRKVGGEPMAKICLKLLDHADERFRRAARANLASNKAAVQPLLRLLQTARSPQLVQAAAELLVQLRSHLGPKLLRSLSDKAVRLLATNTRLGDLLLDVVLADCSAKDVDTLMASALRLRRAKRYAEALHLLARLAATPHGVPESHYQLAVTRLLADMARQHGPAEEAPPLPGNATMGYFAALVRQGFPLSERLRKETVLVPEALLRLANHFRDAVGPERRFGTELLQHLAARTKGRASEEARVVLRTIGA